jgi:hypothetical protein
MLEIVHCARHIDIEDVSGVYSTDDWFSLDIIFDRFYTRIFFIN